MSVIERITNDVRASLKAGDSLRTGALRLLLTELKNLEISRRSKSMLELGDDELVVSVRRLIAQEKETLDYLLKDERKEQAEESKKKISIFEGYLPKELSSEELDALIKEAIEEAAFLQVSGFGSVMKILVKKVANRAEGNRVSSRLKEVLSSQ